MVFHFESRKLHNAWIHHQKNKHHWQAWCSIGERGVVIPIDIPEKYVKEMISDWAGAGRVYYKKTDPAGWYATNKDKLVFTENTRKLIEKILQEYFE